MLDRKKVWSAPQATADVVTFLSRHVELFAIFGISLVVLGWFGSRGVVLNVDSFFVLKPVDALRDSVSGWIIRTSTGSPNFAIQQAPFYAAYSALTFLLGLRLAQEVILFALFSGAALAMHMLLKSLIDGDSLNARVARVFASILYVANPFTTSFLWWHQTWMEFTWILLPLTAVAILRTARGADWVRIGAWSVLAEVLLAPGLPHVFLPLLAVFAAAPTVAVLAGRDSRRLKSLLGLFAAWLVGVLWWLAPSLYHLKRYLAQWQQLYNTPPEVLLHGASANTSLDNVFRLTGLVHLYQFVEGESYYVWFEAFRSGFLSWSLYGLPLLAICGVVFIRWASSEPLTRRCAVSFAILWCFGSFAMKGDHEPFSAVNRALIHLPFGSAWQHPYDKFALLAVPSAAILAGLGFRALAERFGGHAREGIIIAAAAVCLVEGWPIFSGTVLPQQQSIIPGALVEVPHDYTQAQRLIELRGSHVLQLPPHTNGETSYNWPRGAQSNNDPILENYVGRNQAVLRIFTGNKHADAVVKAANAALVDGVAPGNVVSALGIGTIVLQGDWNERYMPSPLSVASYRAALNGGVSERLHVAFSSRAGSLPVSITRDARIEPGTRLTLVAQFRGAGDAVIATIGRDMILKWNSPGYIGLQNTRSGSWAYGSPVPYSNRWFAIELGFGRQTVTITMNGVRQTTMPFRYDVAKKLDVTFPAQKAAPAFSIAGVFVHTTQTDITLSGERLSDVFQKARWQAASTHGAVRVDPFSHSDIGALSLYQDSCPTPMLYSTTGHLIQETDDAMAHDPAMMKLGREYACGPDPAAVVDPLKDGRGTTSPGFSVAARRDSMPTSMTATVHGKGRSLLVLNTTYDDQWYATSDSSKVTVVSHQLVNRYANGFMLDGDGTASISIRYRGQNVVLLSGICGAFVAFGAALALLLTSKRLRSDAV